MINSRFVAWTIWLMASIFYAYQYVLRVMPSIMIDDIMHKFNIEATIFGQFSGVYYLGYSLMHLPIGILLDKFGPKKIMPICMLLTIIGMLPIIFAEHWIYPIIGRILVGIGSSAAILGTFKIVRLAFSEEKFARMLSFSVTIGLIGAIYGGAPVAYMNKVLGYENVIYIFAFLGVILAIVTYVVMPDISVVESHSMLHGMMEVLSNKKVLLTCLFAGLMVGPIEGFADIWGPAFFAKVYQLDLNLSATLSSTIFIGMCFGAPVLSIIAEKLNNYIGTIIGAGILMCSIFTVLLVHKLTNGSISILLTIVGVCCAYQILAIYKATTYVSDNVVGLTTAMANMIIMLFGYFFHSIIGIIVHKFSNEPVLSYSYGISIIPICLLIGSIGFISLALHDRSKKV